MKKPKSVEPPKLATWLLERFSPESGPLAGDLIEAFKHGRSSSWYWKQVLAAILIALLQLMRRNIALFAYTVACSAAISIAWFFMFPNAARDSVFPRVFALYSRSYGIDWPWSFTYQMSFLTAFQTAIVMVALIAHLTISRQLRRRNVLQALLVVVVVLATGNVALPLISGLLSGLQWGGWVCVSAPAAIALILGNWKATRSRGSPLHKPKTFTSA
jgi:hypothetical protein